MKGKVLMPLLTLTLAAVMVGCTATERGAVTGGAIGAGAGAIIGSTSGDAGKGALIGGAIGALGGGVIGHQVDKSQQEERNRQHREQQYESERTEYREGSHLYEGEYDSQGRRWVPEQEEIVITTEPDGTRHEKRTIIPGHYE